MRKAKASEYVSFVCKDLATNILIKDIEAIVDSPTCSDVEKAYMIHIRCFSFAKHIIDTYAKYKREFK